MTRSLLLTITATAALAAPFAAHAQSDGATVTVSGNVDKACAIGEPTSITLTVGDLTGPDGRVDPALTGAASIVSTEIASAWCNTPSMLSLDGAPMALTPTPGYSTPTGFARLVTYDATLTGWSSELVDRPLSNDAAKTVTTNTPYAAANLTLDISALEALDTDGAAPDTTAVLEAGAYSGSVVVSVSVQP